MKLFAALIAFLQFLVLPAAAQAQGYYGSRTVSTTSWTEEWDPVSESWVRIEDDDAAQVTVVTTITTHVVNAEVVSQTRETVAGAQAPHRAARYAAPVPRRARGRALAQYGPFRVIGTKRAQLTGSTGSRTPAQFDAMLRDFPELEVLEMVEAPGTSNDIANLAVGRRIRAAGLRTHVPDGGSVRSGAVELFLAGERPTMAAGAQFAVHSWLDNHGREPDDFSADAPEHRLYLDYYIEMGMSEEAARDFYAMTNSVPHAEALWLRARDMEKWLVRSERASRELAHVEFLEAGSDRQPLDFALLPLEPVALPTVLGRAAPAIVYGEMMLPMPARTDLSLPDAS